jgi:hypothetical protein
MRSVFACMALLVAACGGRSEAPRSHRAATLTPSPPSAPAPRTMPTPTPGTTQQALAPDPFMVPTLTPEQRAAAIDAWVRGPLRGRDNDMAHLRGVTITRRADATFGISIRNQFRWTCSLEFDAAGRPATMRHCVSAEPSWYADPDELHFQCTTNGTDELCDAPYTLGERSVHMRDPAKFRILRPLVRPVPPPQPHVLLI